MNVTVPTGIGWKLFVYFESFTGLTKGMIVASLQDVGNSPDNILFYLHEIGVFYRL